MTIPPMPALPPPPSAPAGAAPADRDAGGDFHALVQQHLDRGRDDHARAGSTDRRDTRAARAPGTKKPVTEANVDRARDLPGTLTASTPGVLAAAGTASTPVVVPSSDAALGQVAAAGGAAEAAASPLGGVALPGVATSRPDAASVGTPGPGASGPGQTVTGTPAARSGQTGQVAQAGLRASGAPVPATQAAADGAPVTAAGSATAPAATAVSEAGPVPTAPAAGRPPAPSGPAQLSEPAEPVRKTRTGTSQVPVDAASPTPAAAPGSAAVPPAHAEQVNGTAPAPAATGSAQTGASMSSPVLDQVLPAVPRLVSRGDGTQRLTLKLHPADLGEVHLTVTVRGGSVDVTLAAGHEAREALREGSSQLRSLLELTGHTTGQLVIRDLPGGGSTASAAPAAGGQPGPTGGQTGSHPGGDQPATTFGQQGDPRQQQGGGPTRTDASPGPSDPAGGAPDPEPQDHATPRANRGSAVALDVRI